MLSSFGTGGVGPVNRAKAYYPVSRRSGTQKTSGSQKRDTFSAESVSRSDSFHRSLVGRLSQEVRAATTTGDIQELRRSVAAGEYQPDPMSIARSILFMAEE